MHKYIILRSIQIFIFITSPTQQLNKEEKKLMITLSMRDGWLEKKNKEV